MMARLWPQTRKWSINQLKPKPAIIDDKQIQAIKTKIYDYLGISEGHCKQQLRKINRRHFMKAPGTHKVMQMSLGIYQKIFNEREQAFGNSIILESGRLQFGQVTQQKAELITNLLPMGILSINEAREILNLPSIDDGHKYIKSLNYVNKDIADQYQLTKGGERMKELEHSGK